MSIKRDRKHSQKGVHGKQQQKKEVYYPTLKKLKTKKKKVKNV